jgi:hypothetical protein
VGKPPASHRYNHLPLLRSSPGGVRRELVVQDLPGTKVLLFAEFTKQRLFIFYCIPLLYSFSESYSEIYFFENKKPELK